jgi:hypothetical protein
MDQPPYTSAEFHADVHKHMVNVAVSTLADTKLDWAQLEPFLEAGRSICRDDIRLNGRIAIHGVEARDEALVEAEEAYLSISVRDREDGTEWLSQSYWLSDLALADQEPERVRSALAAIERSAAKLREWLAARSDAENNDAGESIEPPPAPSA